MVEGDDRSRLRWADELEAEDKLKAEAAEEKEYQERCERKKSREIYIGSSTSDAAYRKATNLEEEITGRKEASSGGGLGFAGAAGIIVAGYGLYRLIDYLGDKF